MFLGRKQWLRPAALVPLALIVLSALAGNARTAAPEAALTGALSTSSRQLETGWWLGPDGINALPLQERTLGRGAVVAVVDTGVKFEIAALAGRAWVGEEITSNGIDDDRNGIVDDAVGVDAIQGRGSQVYGGGHGTVVASIIAASHQQAPGVAPESKIVPVSVTRDGEHLEMTDGIRALLLLARRPEVNVVNLSWGAYGELCTSYLDQLQKAIAALAAQQKLVVAAAGNEPRDLDSDPFCPAVATAPEGIVVTASLPNSTFLPWAGRGLKSVNAIAPGNFIHAVQENGHIDMVVGTSFSAPLVSGAAALLYSLHPHSTSAEIRAALLAAERPAARDPFGDEIVATKLIGGGIVDTTKAEQLLAEDADHVPTAFEQLSPRNVRAAKGARITVRWKPSFDGRLAGYDVLLRCQRCARKFRERTVSVAPASKSVQVKITAVGEYEISVTAFDEDGHQVAGS